VLIQQDIWLGTSFRGVTGVGFEDMCLVVVVTEACNVLRSRMCSSYTAVLVRLLVGCRVGMPSSRRRRPVHVISQDQFFF